MASRNEEYIAVAAVLISLVVLSIFFGILWSFLLVFTGLLLAYLFGRPQTKPKMFTKKFRIKGDSVDNSLDDSEYLSSVKEMDVPFTGLPSPKYRKQSLRSPMPLLSSFSTITKRLSFNLSAISPQDGQIYANNASRRLSKTIGSPRQSPMSPITSPQTPKYFSLINPILNQPSTVKIATPQVNNSTFSLAEPVQLTDSPLSRTTILSALKQSTIRKRSVVEDEDSNEDVSSSIENHKKKRRYNYPSAIDNENSKLAATDNTDLELTREVLAEPPAVTRKSSGIYSLIQTRLKRRPLHDDGINTTEGGGVVKKTRQDFEKTAELSKVNEKNERQYNESTSITRDAKNTTMTTANRSASQRLASKTNYDDDDDDDDDDNDSGCDADDDDDVVMKTVPTAAGAERLSKRQALTEKNRATPTHTPKKSVSRQPSTPSRTPDLTASRQHRVSKKQRQLNTSTISETMTSSNDLPASENPDISSQEMSPKKRFTVIRFPSKKDESKRRPVPVYCASVNSPDLPKRRSVSHKITKEDIELDRKMAWQRVQSLLDGSEDEEGDDKSKAGSSSPVAIHVTTCMPSPSRLQTSTIATTSGSTQPSTLLSSLAASKPNEVTVQPSVQTQSESSTTALTSTSDAKSTMFSKGVLGTSFGAGPSGQSSLASTTQASTTQGSSLGFTPSITCTASTVDGSAPATNLLGASTFKSLNPTSLISLATSSKSIQTPICTPVTQAFSNSKTINTAPSVTTVPASFSLNFGSTTSNLPVGVNTTNSPQVGTNTSSIPPQTGFNVSSNLLQSKTNTSSNPTQFGFNTLSNPPQMGLNTSSNPPQMGLNTFSNPPRMGLNTSSNPPQMGLNTLSNPPQMGLNTLSNPPQMGLNMSSNPPQMGLNTSSNPTQMGLNTSSNRPQMGLNTLSNPPQMGLNTSSNRPQMGLNTLSNPPQMGLNAFSNPPQMGLNISSNLLKSGFRNTSSQFSGLSASTTGTSLSSTTKVATQASQPSFATPRGFSFNTPSVPKTTSQASTFSFSGSQQATNAFGSQTGQTGFGTAPPTTQSTFKPTTGALQNTFGSGLNSTTNAFGTNTSTQTFGAPPTPAFGAPSTKSTPAFGAPSTASTPAFGLSSTNSQNAFGTTGTSGTPGGFKFVPNTATPNAFGSAKQPTTASSVSSGQFSFSSSNAPTKSQTKVGFSFAAGGNSSTTPQTFGAASSQSGGFGAGTTTNTFGAPSTQSPFGAPTNRNAFGSQSANVPSAPSNQNAFGGATTQSAFGSSAPQNAFGNPAGTSGTGGFGFSGGATNTPSAGGFKFGGVSGVSGGFQNTPSAAPAFGPAPSPVPAFGATPATGGFAFGSAAQTHSSAVARARPKATATRRRQRK